MISKETVLTDEQINEAWSNNLTGMFMSGDQIKKFARDIEQAILKSPEIKALKRDKERLDWLADVNNTICTVLLPRDIVYRNLHSLRDAIDDAIRSAL